MLVASSYSQAKVVYRYALTELRRRGVDFENRSEWVHRDSVSTALVRSKKTGRAIRALGCDPRRAHGRVFGLAILDEPAQWAAGTC